MIPNERALDVRREVLHRFKPIRQRIAGAIGIPPGAFGPSPLSGLVVMWKDRERLQQMMARRFARRLF